MNEPETIEISLLPVFIYCPHGHAIGRVDSDTAPGLSFCQPCADAWDNGAKVVKVR